MPEQHGTASTPWNFGQYNEVFVAVARALPQALQGTEPKQLLASLEGRGQELERALQQMFSSFVSTTVVPADDEWFELKVDYRVDPAEVVHSAGYNPEGWKFLGPVRKGWETHRAKFVRLGWVQNLAEAEQRAGVQGYRLLGGHAREPFKAKFPRPDGHGPVIFGGSQWRGPVGSPSVTCLSGLGDGWRSGFRWSGDDFSGFCRWAVVSK